jgi:hypothetical protein
VRTKDSGTLQFDTYLNDDESECMVIERYRAPSPSLTRKAGCFGSTGRGSSDRSDA